MAKLIWIKNKNNDLETFYKNFLATISTTIEYNRWEYSRETYHSLIISKENKVIFKFTGLKNLRLVKKLFVAEVNEITKNEKVNINK